LSAAGVSRRAGHQLNVQHAHVQLMSYEGAACAQFVSPHADCTLPPHLPTIYAPTPTTLAPIHTPTRPPACPAGPTPLLTMSTLPGHKTLSCYCTMSTHPPTSSAVLCRAVLCCAVPCRAVPCRAVPCCAVLCHVQGAWCPVDPTECLGYYSMYRTLTKSPTHPPAMLCCVMLCAGCVVSC
jgi:hypothetical protein